jgi:hypothetical protein
MEILDRGLARPLAMLGDHVLYQFRRTMIDAHLGRTVSRSSLRRLERAW